MAAFKPPEHSRRTEHRMGPPPDNCQQNVSCSLLCPRDGQGAFEAGPLVWIQPPPRIEPLRYIERLLIRSRLSDPEQLRGMFELPPGRWLVRELRPAEVGPAQWIGKPKGGRAPQLDLVFTGAPSPVLF